jgi:hypothetical protein
MARHDQQSHAHTHESANADETSQTAVQGADPTASTTDAAAPPAAPTAATGVQPAAAVAPPVTDDRYRKIALDDAGSAFAYGDASKSGSTVNRIDFIRQSWTVARQGRGAIAKELTRLSGKKVSYQIVFSATKNTAGGPVAPTAPATPGTQTPPASA